MFPTLYGRDCSYNETLTVSGAGNFFFDYRSPYLYVTDQGTAGNGVFKIYDCSASGTPVLKSTTSLPAGSGPVHPKAHALPGYGTVCLIPYKQSHVFAVWDVNDPTAPSLLGSISVGGQVNNVAAIGTVACVGIFDSPLTTGQPARRIDMSNPASMSITNSWTDANKRGTSVRASTDHFFVAGETGSAGGTYVAALRASDLAFRSSASTGSPFTGIFAGQAMAINPAFTVVFTAGGNGDTLLAGWNISDPAAVSLIGRSSVGIAGGGANCMALKDDTHRLYIGDGSAIRIVNVSNPNSPTQTGTISTGVNSVSDAGIINDGCAGLAWGQGNGAAIHLMGTPPLS